jgi:hypothetical protein
MSVPTQVVKLVEQFKEESQTVKSKYIEGFVEGCLERIGEDEPEEENLFRDLWEDEGERETVLAILQAECEVFPGRPEDYFAY